MAKRKVEPYSFDEAAKAWGRPPIDEVGYVSSRKLLGKSDDELIRLVFDFESNRYGGWRNVDNLWRETLGLDSTTGATVLDFGCGAGIEALQFARSGNKVILADINQDNLDLAERVLNIHGYSTEKVLVTDKPPYFTTTKGYDLFYSNGVLHHTPKIWEILCRVFQTISRNGEVRLMLYSDRGWKWATGSMPDNLEPACRHKRFDDFVRKFDGVGHYADWYSYAKLKELVDELYQISDFNYITEKNGFFGQYITTTLQPRFDLWK